MNYTEIIIKTPDTELQNLLIAELSVIGFDGFEELDTELKAFSSENKFDKESLDFITRKYEVIYTEASIPQQNWNELWESNFSPICVDDFVGIRASFHQPLTTVQYEIVITPKMSFGTGHHATTYMMMQLMRDIDFTNKSVFDFGIGTGILAILAEKLGSNLIEAVDYDDWCIENSIENIAQNNCNYIHIAKADTAITTKKFDIVLANINKNIILDNVSALTNDAVKGGLLLLSGLLEQDEKDILAATGKEGWQHLKTVNRNNWIAMLFTL